ncbi:Lipoate-protein ligase A [Methanocella conradii HZ254]|uniref:Lipoate-protein ligase A n=1 Tax=Methanocella conradii (strain DSM 24694 / JCM 17849 / CGMCC 1.5162 / HZ254) TaxID=1041930 RepID=H8I4P3_METCZ|nr:biotin/lipoate A/B protein ligase family protein [Methanocella conradii]AFD00638.1 Lipoate-protein ligase A [Methanocella conradii HZ254]MDI6896336.1 biotin/lipoate A/B protein ligase family protein [Methanocella conradii]
MWRVVGLNAYSAVENMAIDDAIAECVASGLSPPTMRFYRWLAPGAVSIGRFQNARDEIDVDACRRLGIDIVRRRTGGGAVFHNGEITYSVAAPERCFPSGIRESYREICSYIIRGLSYLGIKADFRPINDVIVNGKKISGSAQTRRNGVLLQHGTILYRLDRQTMFTVLKPSKLKLSDKPASSFEAGIASVKELTGASIEQLYDALLRGFTEGKEWRLGALTENELAFTKAIIKKYDSYEWNFSR